MAASMREPTFWILTALASEPRHGYGVIQQAAALSGGRVTLQAGTLYAALDRLAAEGLVEVDREEQVDGRTRRYYRLTPPGASALGAETERLRHSIDAATAQLKRFGLGPAVGSVGSPAVGAAPPSPGFSAVAAALPPAGLSAVAAVGSSAVRSARSSGRLSGRLSAVRPAGRLAW